MLTRLMTLTAATALGASLLVSPTPADARNRTGAIIGGIAAGAIIGGAIAGANRGYGYGPGYAPGYYEPAPVYAPPPRVYRSGPSDEVSYCMSRFRSYRPDTGTYVGYDGIERPCP